MHTKSERIRIQIPYHRHSIDQYFYMKNSILVDIRSMVVMRLSTEYFMKREKEKKVLEIEA